MSQKHVFAVGMYSPDNCSYARFHVWVWIDMPYALSFRWPQLEMICLLNWKRGCHLQPQELFVPVCESTTVRGTLSLRPPSGLCSSPDCPCLSLTALIGVALNAFLLWMLTKSGTKSRIHTSQTAGKEREKEWEDSERLLQWVTIRFFLIN